MKRNACVVFALAVAGVAGNSFALGLGDIKLHSALGQKLDADIPLIGMHKSDLNSANVQLASSAAFQHAGLERADVLSQLQFRIASTRDGAPLVNVTSRQPINAPFLDFLVVANWAHGSLEREYTVLLNPPSFKSSGATSSPAAQGVSPILQHSAKGAAGVRRPPATTPKSAAMRTIPVSAGSYGPVKKGETLAEIARRMRPDDAISLDQMMIAIYRANPNAFMGNINTIKAGYGLERPATSRLRALGIREARSAVARQNQAWRTGRPLTAAPAEARVASTQSEASRDPAKPANNGLKLLPAAVTKLSNSTPQAAAAPPGTQVKSQTGRQKIARLQKQVTAVQQQKARAEHDSVRLRGAVKRLRRKLSKAQRLLSVKNNRLASLQRQANTRTAARLHTPRHAATWPMTPFALVLMAGALLSLLVVLAVRRRRAEMRMLTAERKVGEPTGTVEAAAEILPHESDHHADHDVENSHALAVSPAAASGGDPRGSQPSELDRTFREDEQQGEAEQKDDILIGASDVPDQSDPVANADFYMAYGLYSEAGDVIKQSLAGEPERSDLQFKLLEIHFATGDRKAYIDSARSSRGSLEPQAWEKVVAMGRELAPDEAVFKNTDSTPAAVIDLPFDTSTSRAALAPDDENSLDLELPERIHQMRQETISESHGDDENGIDFDISSLELVSPAEAPSGALERELAPEQTSADTAVAEPGSRIDLERAFGELSDRIDADAEQIVNLDTSFLEVETEAATLCGEEGDDRSATATKLDLARAYLDMDDIEGARAILEEVIDEGAPEQQYEAQGLLKKLLRPALASRSE